MRQERGKLVPASRTQDQYDQTITPAGEQNISVHDAEVLIFHTGHNNVGTYLIGLWGLPIPVLEAIGFHHCLEGYPEGVFIPALAVHVANGLYHENKAAEGIDAQRGLELGYLENIGFADRMRPGGISVLKSCNSRIMADHACIEKNEKVKCGAQNSEFRRKNFIILCLVRGLGEGLTHTNPLPRCLQGRQAQLHPRASLPSHPVHFTMISP